MASYRDLLDAIARVGAATGNPEAWKDGLTGADVAIACTPTSPSGAFDAVLAKLSAAHPAVFAPTAANDRPPPAAQGAAADAIRGAESQLARQRSDAAQVDLQVLTAIVNAHATASEGLAQLGYLQRDIERAVASRTDLDTPAGARELQRYFISKMRDIRDVVQHAGLDASSRAALAEALVALYAASTPTAPGGAPGTPLHSPDDPENTTPPTTTPPTTTPPTTRGSDREGVAAGASPLNSPEFDDPSAGLPDYLADDFPMPDPGPPAPPVSAAPATAVPAVAAPPYGAAIPAAPPFGAMPPLGAPSGGGLPNLGSAPGLAGSTWPDFSPAGLTEPDRLRADVRDSVESPSTNEPTGAPDGAVTDTAAAERSPGEDEARTQPTPVALPDGRTVIAPSPELASVITAAVAGAPIATAFGWQGIAIPAPGSPVVVPVDPARLVPGDIGVLADRHALALGNGEALLDNRIQPISSVTGPGFLGWQHPPAPDPMNNPPVAPAPDRSPATAPS